MKSHLLVLLLCAIFPPISLASSPLSYKRDLCANFRADLSEQLGEVFKYKGQHRESRGRKDEFCLCVSGLQSFVDTNYDASIAAAREGKWRVVQALTQIIQRNHPQNCVFPSNSEPACQGRDVCGFTCTLPYVKSPDGRKCVLPPSHRPHPEKERYKRSPGYELVLGNSRKTLCPVGQKLCPVWRRTPTLECVDVKYDLFSCGGCMYEEFMEELGDKLISGVDCSAIEGVSDVACVEGTCKVRKCSKGWTVSEDGRGCKN